MTRPIVRSTFSSFARLAPSGLATVSLSTAIMSLMITKCVRMTVNVVQGRNIRRMPVDRSQRCRSSGPRLYDWTLARRSGRKADRRNLERPRTGLPDRYVSRNERWQDHVLRVSDRRAGSIRSGSPDQSFRTRPAWLGREKQTGRLSRQDVFAGRGSRLRKQRSRESLAADLLAHGQELHGCAP